MSTLMRAHALFICTYPCSSVHTDACPSMHTHVEILSTHTRDLHAYVGTQKLTFFFQFYSFSLIFPFFLSNHDSHAPFHLFFAGVTHFHK